MVHEHFEEHKTQLFAGKKLKNHGRARKKIGLKCSLGEYDTTVNLQKNTIQCFASHTSIVECCQQVALALCYQQ